MSDAPMTGTEAMALKRAEDYAAFVADAQPVNGAFCAGLGIEYPPSLAVEKLMANAADRMKSFRRIFG